MRRLFWIAFLVLDAVLLLLFAAGYAAFYLPPEPFWWAELVAIGLPYLSIILIVAAAVAAANRAWGLLLIHLVFLVAMLARVVVAERIFRPVQPDDGDMTLLTLNVPRWRHEMGVMREDMRRLVASVDPDVVALQEAHVAFHPDAPTRRAAPYVSLLYDSLGFQTIGPRVRGATYTPQPVLAKAPLIEQSQTMLHLGRKEYETFVTRTLLRWEGREVALYNLHLHSYGEDKPWRQEEVSLFNVGFWRRYLRQYRDAYRVRAWEARRIHEILSRERLPMIVCGDLNSTPYNWAYGLLASGLQDAFRLAGEGWGMTYHSSLPFARIDYVLASDDWEIVSARTIESDISDHRPVVVRMRWRDGR